LTDSQTLVWLLNQPPNDLPNAMMTRWLAYIRLFDFDVKHIKGTKNGAADGLSRRGKGECDECDSDPDDYFDARLYASSYDDRTAQLNRYQVYRVSFNPELYADDRKDQVLGTYLSSLQRPDGLTDAEFGQLRKRSKDFLVRDGMLFKRSRHRGIPPRRVVGLISERKEVIQELHDESGHLGQKATYHQAAKRYQWRGMYSDVIEWVKTCDECQRLAKFRFEEPLHPTWSITVWEKVGLDVVYMPWEDNDGFLVLARDDLSGYVEGRALKEVNSHNVARFLQEEVICRHGVPRRIVMDGGSENLNFTAEVVRNYGIHGVAIAPYHPQSNGLVERGHQSIINALSKYKAQDVSRASRTWQKDTSWNRYLALALWADRITVRRTTGYSAFELVYGRECLLPVQLAITSWSLVDWDEVQTRDDLILARMRQLDERVTQVDIAAMNQRRTRTQNKAYFDASSRIRPRNQLIDVGDLVLAFRYPLLRGRKHKLDERWQGPYRVISKPMNSTFYLLAEMDGTPLKRKFAGNQLKKYLERVPVTQPPSSLPRHDDVNDVDNGGDGDQTMQVDEMPGDGEDDELGDTL